MTEEDSNQDADARLAMAARWRVLLTERGEAPAEFAVWLNHPESLAAWTSISDPWDFLGKHGDAPVLLAARREALEDARRHDVRPFWYLNRRHIAAGIAAALFLIVVVLGAVLWLERPANYVTAEGERRVITLVDGSRISLDSNSEVTVRYTRSARLLQLMRGQAVFYVAHDVERPFSVLAGTQKVIATGTIFNIDLSSSGTLITLVEGHVVVVDEISGTAKASIIEPHQTELAAGQQLTASPDKNPNVADVDVQHVTAWTNGQLIFDNAPLAQAVARVSRYTSEPIEISDPKVGMLRISGVFNTGDASDFLSALTQYLPIRAVRLNSGAIMLESDEKK